MGIGFLVALVAMALIREFFGAGSLFDYELEFMKNVKIPVLAQPAGGFLVFGIVIAIMNKLTEKKGGVKRKSFDCEGCPSAHLCNKTSCSELAELAAGGEQAEKVAEEKTEGGAANA